MKILIGFSLVVAAAIAIPIFEVGTTADTDVTANINGDNTDLKDHIPVLVGGGGTNANTGVLADVAMFVKDPIPGKAETVFTNINGDNTDLKDNIPVLVRGGETNANIGVPADAAIDIKDPISGKEDTAFTNINAYNTDLKDHVPVLVGGGETNANIGASVAVAKDVKDPTPVSEDTAKDLKDPTSEVDGIPIDEELFMLLASFADPITEVKPDATR